jgi:molybdopterin converting factor small subunit
MSTVRIPPTLRAEADGKRTVDAEGATVREVMEALSRQFPALGARIFHQGELPQFVNIYVEGEDVRTRDGLETPVPDGATVILLPAMAGG